MAGGKQFINGVLPSDREGVSRFQGERRLVEDSMVPPLEGNSVSGKRYAAGALGGVIIIRR